MTTMQFTLTPVVRCDRCEVVLTCDERDRTDDTYGRAQCFGCRSVPGEDMMRTLTFASIPTPGKGDHEWVRRVRMAEQAKYWGTSTHTAQVGYWMLETRRMTEFQNLAIG